MKIEIYIITYNDEKIMMYTLRHYLPLGKVIILDNNSSDHTRDIAEYMGATVRQGGMPNELDDLKLAEIKSNCWKGSDADWVIVVDADEFVYCKDIVEVLSRTNATLIKPTWIEMFAEKYPTIDGQIYDEVKTGVIGGGFKTNLFKPSGIKEINFGVGCHSCNPEGNVVWGDIPEILCLHMKHLSLQLLLDKAEHNKKRLSEGNKVMGWSCHFLQSPKEIKDFFDKYLALSQQVIP
jgi:hypothetical protein